ncbi:MAG: hypothetical protein ACTSVI_12190 [Promethearchaeota archaeon]
MSAFESFVFGIIIVLLIVVLIVLSIIYRHYEDEYDELDDDDDFDEGKTHYTPEGKEPKIGYTYRWNDDDD